MRTTTPNHPRNPRNRPRLRDQLAAALRDRHQTQVLDRPWPQRLRLAPLAAYTFLPRGGGLAFASPIHPVRELLLVTLTRAIAPGGPRRETLRATGHAARVDPDTAVTVWDRDTAVFAYDLSLLFGAPGGVPPHRREIARTLLDLDRCAERWAGRGLGIPGHPVLPRTLIGFPPGPGVAIEPEPTPAVLARAHNLRAPWAEAWASLRYETEVPAALNRTGLRLVDTRLCTRLRPHAVAEFHDLRDLLGRSVRDPEQSRPGRAATLRCMWLGEGPDALVFNGDLHHCDLRPPETRPRNPKAVK